MPLITKYFKGKSFKKKRRAMVEAVNDAYTSTARAVVPKKLQYEFGVDDDTVALTKDKRDYEIEVEQKQDDFEAAIAQADREPDPAEVERFLKPYDSTFDDFNEMAIQVRFFPQPASHLRLYSSAPAIQPSYNSRIRKSSATEGRTARR